MMLRLIMRRGPTPGIVYDLEADEITIGRGNKSSIVIRDNEVSRDHCRLVRLMGDYEVHDLNSSNGTFVNGQRVIVPWLLQPGALIELGDTITLEYGTQPAKTEPLVDPAPAIPANPHYGLKMIKGSAVGYVYPLEGSRIAVGRDRTNDFVIQDPEISRYHVRLHLAQNGYQIEDLGSTNGTYVNGEPVREAQCLEPNDVLKLGTMVQLQYIVREDVDENGDDDTPMKRPPEQEADWGKTMQGFFRVDPNRRTVTARSTGLEPGALLDHLMIVYAREDWESIVAPLLVRLQDTRLNAWVDQYLTLDSDDWRIAVEQALTECWLMILVVPRHLPEATHVKMMYRYFLNENKPIIALLRDASQTLPSELNRLRSILYDSEANPRSFHKLVFEIMQRHQQP